jgi:WD40 repeat protein
MKSSMIIALSLCLLCAGTALTEQNAPTYRTLVGHKGSVLCLDFSPDGKYLASGSKDNKIKLWDVASGQEIREFYYSAGFKGSDVHSISFSPDGKYLANSNAQALMVYSYAHIWNIATGQKIRSITDKNGSIEFAAFSSDGRYLLYGRPSVGTIDLFNLENNRVERSIQLSVGANLLLNPAVFAYSTRYVAFGVSDVIEVRDVTNGRLLRTFSDATDQITSLCFNADGSYLAGGSEDGTMKIWELANGKLLYSLVGHNKDVTCFGFSPDGMYLASGSKDKTIRLWDLKSGAEVHSIQVGSEVYAVCFSPDGLYLACGDKDEKIILYEVSGMPVLDLKYWATVRKLKDDEDSELRELADFFVPKDEFETEQEYSTRIAKGNMERQSIEKKYSMRLAQIEKEFQENRQIESQRKKLETQSKIRESLAEAAFKIENIGAYDAENETFPITVNGITDNVKVPRDEARSLKEKWQQVEVIGMKQLKSDLTTWDYFNLYLVHPETGNKFAFGSHRNIDAIAGLSQTGAGPSRSVVPPALSLKAWLVDPNGNGFLDAEEKAHISVEISNSGQGPAYGIILDLRSETADPKVYFSRTKIVDEIPAGETKAVEFDIEAEKSVERASQNFVVSATESNGFNPDPVKLIFETYPLLLPELTLVDYGIHTASGDNIISVGEVTNIQVRVQNRGRGKAKGIKFNVNLPPNVFFAPQSQESFAVDEINSGEFKDFEFAVLTNPQVAKQIVINLGMTEENTQGSFPLELDIEKPLQSIEEFVVRGKEQEALDFGDVATLTVDIEKDIPKTTLINNEAMAVVIGNRNYSINNPDVPNVDFAIRDAALVKEYLIKTLGYKEGNILYYKDANYADFRSLFGTESEPNGRLAQMVVAGRSDIFIYYSGHGAPDVTNKKGYFVPVDCAPGDVRLNGYPLEMLYTNLGQVDARSTTVVIDACFSGGSQAGMLIDAASPIGFQVINPAMMLKNAAVFTSSGNDEISSWFPEKKHGLFTYFFLKGLKESADQNEDGQISAGELQSYLSDQSNGVPYWARRLHRGRQQTPGFSGNDSIIVRGKIE